jgi:hypothetical protein
MTRPRLGTVLAIAALLAGACDGNGADGQTPPPDVNDETARLEVAAEGLCRTFELVEAGDLEEARAVFMDQSHDFLHQVAARGLDGVPRETALLLEAKQKVEQGLDNPGEPSAALTQAVFDVHSALSDLAAELGLPRPEPCPGAAS